MHFSVEKMEISIFIFLCKMLLTFLFFFNIYLTGTQTYNFLFQQ